MSQNQDVTVTGGLGCTTLCLFFIMMHACDINTHLDRIADALEKMVP